ncbi:MAG: hypothetical protein WC935_00090 [Thermoleophilia bacterium]
MTSRFESGPAPLEDNMTVIEDQELKEVGVAAKQLKAALGAINRDDRPLDTADCVEILHAIARYMTIHNIER